MKENPVIIGHFATEGRSNPAHSMPERISDEGHPRLIIKKYPPYPQHSNIEIEDYVLQIINDLSVPNISPSTRNWDRTLNENEYRYWIIFMKQTPKMRTINVQDIGLSNITLASNISYINLPHLETEEAPNTSSASTNINNGVELQSNHNHSSLQISSRMTRSRQDHHTKNDGITSNYPNQRKQLQYLHKTQNLQRQNQNATKNKARKRKYNEMSQSKSQSHPNIQYQNMNQQRINESLPKQNDCMKEIERIAIKYDLGEISTNKLYHFASRLKAYQYVDQLFKSHTVDSIKDYIKQTLKTNLARDLKTVMNVPGNKYIISVLKSTIIARFVELKTKSNKMCQGIMQRKSPKRRKIDSDSKICITNNPKEANPAGFHDRKENKNKEKRTVNENEMKQDKHDNTYNRSNNNVEDDHSLLQYDTNQNQLDIQKKDKREQQIKIATKLVKSNNQYLSSDDRKNNKIKEKQNNKSMKSLQLFGENRNNHNTIKTGTKTKSYQKLKQTKMRKSKNKTSTKDRKITMRNQRTPSKEHNRDIIILF